MTTTILEQPPEILYLVHGFAEAGAEVAARPNLNKPGVLTVHPLRVRGSVNYGRRMVHLEPGACVILRDVRPDVSSKAHLIAKGTAKFPCSSLVGTPTFMRPDGMAHEVLYNPRVDPDHFRERDTGKRLRSAAYALLLERRAWVWDPTWLDDE